MNKQHLPIDNLEEELRGREEYERARRVVREFGEKRSRTRREQIIISPYAEHPWILSPDITSTRWSDGQNEQE